MAQRKPFKKKVKETLEGACGISGLVAGGGLVAACVSNNPGPGLGVMLVAGTASAGAGYLASRIKPKRRRVITTGEYDEW